MCVNISTGSTNRMKAIVTGGAGFIGSNLARRLTEHGHSVTIIDNLATGRLENISHLENWTEIDLIEADITDTNSIYDHFKDADWVFHLAALADIVPSIENPSKYHHSN